MFLEPGSSSRHSLSRRTLLGGVLATALVGSGCAPAAPKAPAGPAAPTVASLTAVSPFYIAHRGGGGDWPEMTAFAYEQAAKIPGLKALEISVCLTADGVLVCSHDPTTERVTGVPYTIANETWATLSQLEVTAKDTTNRSQPPQRLTRLDDIIDRYIKNFVLFIEPKVAPAIEPLRDRLTRLHSPERVVWKQELVGTGFTDAKRAGFATWGYVLDNNKFRGANLTRLAADPNIDMLGIPVRGPSSLVQAAAAEASKNQKRTIAWPIISDSDRNLALGFGASGLMTSNIAELMPPVAAGSISPR